jgi:hypothetical protein
MEVSKVHRWSRNARIVGAFLATLLFASVAASVQEGTPVVLKRQVSFLDAPSGKSVALDPGNYFASVADGMLVLQPEFLGEPHRLKAATATHEKKIVAPEAVSFEKSGSEHQIALLMPDGSVVGAIGSVGASFVQARSVLDGGALVAEQKAAIARREIRTRTALAPRVPDEAPAQTGWTDATFPNQIIVKVHDGAAVRWQSTGDSGGSASLDRQLSDATRLQQHQVTLDQAASDVSALNGLLGGAGVEEWEPLFARPLIFLEEDRFEAERLSGSENAYLENFFLVVTTGDEPNTGLVNQLNALAAVELAYFAPVPRVADAPPETPNLETEQHYLDPAPEGIDARYAWTQPGGRGAGWRVIDIEQGWNLGHEDFPGHFFPDRRYQLHERQAGRNATDCRNSQHGTAVIGQIVALNDNHGVTGIASDAGWGVVSPMREYRGRRRLSTPRYRLPEAINVAASLLSPGDVILIEQHGLGPNVVSTGSWSANTWQGVSMSDSGETCNCNCGQYGFVPMEYWRGNFDAIKNATDRGIYVVEAAGNGDMNLDHTRYRLRRNRPSRFDRSVRDSGAIMVGASRGNSRAPSCFSNHGGGVDVHSWGQDVVTTGYGFARCNSSPDPSDGWEVNGQADSTQWYTRSFSGTSSASPIVTGAVLAISGSRRASGKVALTPAQMRQVLSSTGSAQATTGPDGAKRIGPQPDLRRAIPAALAVGTPPATSPAPSPGAAGSGGD